MTHLPTIAVRCVAEGDTLLRTTLTLAPGFSFSVEGASPSLQNYLTHWIDRYLNKEGLPFTLIPKGSVFQEKVWAGLNKTVFGSVLTYGELADQIDHPNAHRAVGNACNKNLYPLFVPCHRVIRAGNQIGGFGLNIEIKRQLLNFEKATPSDSRTNNGTVPF